MVCWVISLMTDFNPRTPVGCDSYPESIGTPSMDFNPRTPVGCDMVTLFAETTVILFQSTHPSGVRLNRP